MSWQTHKEIYNLPWDRGANHLRVLSATCIRWRDLAAPLLLALIDGLRSDAKHAKLELDRGRDVRFCGFSAGVHDVHRACLLAERIKWGRLARCERFRMCNHVGPMFGIALGRALRSNPLGQLRRLDLGGPNGDDGGAGIADSGMVALCDALVGGALPVLEDLNLRGNDIGNPGAIAFGAAASRVGVLQHLQSVQFDWNHITEFGALCLALWMGGLPLLRGLSFQSSSWWMKRLTYDQQCYRLICGQRPFVFKLAVAELMEALSDRLAKELRQAAIAPLPEGTYYLVQRHAPCLVRLQEAWQEDGPAVLELLAGRHQRRKLRRRRKRCANAAALARDVFVLDAQEEKDESSCDITDSADMLADMHSIWADILPDAPQLRSSTRGRGRKGRRGRRGGTHGRQGGTLQGHTNAQHMGRHTPRCSTASVVNTRKRKERETRKTRFSRGGGVVGLT
jgi:hypothetical protein